MSSTDDRIVRMQFDNASFKKGAADTQKQLADLNKSVDAAGKGKGLLDLQSQMGAVAVTASKMQVVTTTALATIANKAVNTGLQIASALTLDPIRSGFTEYESLLTKQNVIMNATGLSAKAVKGYLTQLNHYSDQTIYSFGDMTDSITKFVNAGVPLPRAVTSIKGIANAAAYAGATAPEASRAMYAFSQSMQTGFIMLNDWQQIENANMGTIQFKETLLDAAVAAGTLTKRGDMYITSTGRAISATKGWRDGLQDQWATTEVLNDALGEYADKNSELGSKAFKAAQDVRTFTAFMDTLKESLGSGWSAIFTSLFGNLKQATSFWTGLSNSVSGVVQNFFHFLSVALKTWRNMGGFEKTIQGFKNILAPFGAILETIGKAWGKAFPSSNKGTGKALYGLSAGFEAVTRPLQWLADIIRGTTPIMTVFFQAIRIGGTVLGRVAGSIGDFVKDLLGLVNLNVPKTGGFISFIKSIADEIADAVQKVDQLLSKGASLSKAFGAVDINLPSMPSMPSLPSFGGGDKSASIVSGLSAGVKGLTSSVLGLNKASDDTENHILFNPKAKLDTSRMEDYENHVKSLGSGISEFGSNAKSIFAKIGDVLSNAVDGIGKFLEGFDMTDVVATINLGVMSTFVVSLSRLMWTFSKGFSGFANIGNGVTSALEGLGDGFASFQTKAKAELIKSYGIAIAILAASLLVLSFIPMDRLGKSLAALGITFYMMSKMLNGFMDSLGDLEPEKAAKVAINMTALGGTMIALGLAMIFLATAFLIFNKVDLTSVVKGLATMAIAMELIKRIGEMGEESAKPMLAAGAALVLVSGAMLLLAAALIAFKLVDWGAMGKAGAALGGLTLAIGALAFIPYEGIAKVGLALFAASAGILVMANALIMFGLVQWESIAKAGVVLLGLVVALTALSLLANPVTTMNFLALAGAMLILSFALLALNAVDWSSIGKLAVVFVILIAAAAGLLAVLGFFAPVVPVMLLFAAAVALLGVGLLAFAAALALAMAVAAGGAAAFAALAIGAAVAIATFLQTLAAEAPVMKEALLKILKEMIDTLVQAVPMIIAGIRKMFESMIKEMSKPANGKRAGDQGKSWIQSIADGIKEKIPLIVKYVSELIISFLHALAQKMDEIAAAGAEVLVSFLNGISRKIGDIVDAATDLIIKFAEGIEKGLDKIVNAGIDLIADFLHDLADAIRSGASKIGSGISDVIDAFRDVGVQMMEGLIGGLGSMVDSAIDKLSDIGNGLKDKLGSIFGRMAKSPEFISVGQFMAKGLTKGIQKTAAAMIVQTAGILGGQIALANQYLSKFIQELDQKAIAAEGRAQGIARAALKAQKAANKTKTKTDDKAANALTKAAEKAREEAKEARKKEKAAEAAQDRKLRWENADSAERAEIMAKRAKSQIDGAKRAEENAAAARAEARALAAEAKKGGYTAAQKKDFREEAERLRKEAKEQAEKANKLMKGARDSAAEAMKYQKMAGEEAAASFQEQYEAEAAADAEQERYDKMTEAEKAQYKRDKAAELQAKADKDLARAKKLALTDLDKANKLAQQAMEEADLARQYIDEAMNLEANGGGPSVALDMTAAAAAAFAQYSELFDAAVAAAAATPTVEFNQYNTSPEALTPSEIYRQTNNQLAFAAGKLVPTP